MEAKDLIGKLYPVRDGQGEVVSLKRITSAHDLENVAGFAISLNYSKSLLTIGYAESLKINEGLYQVIEPETTAQKVERAEQLLQAGKISSPAEYFEIINKE